MLEDVKAWLGPERVAALDAQVEGRLDAKITGAIRHAPNVPTAAIWTLQACGSIATAADLKRWSADVREIKKSQVKSRAKTPASPPL